MICSSPMTSTAVSSSESEAVGSQNLEEYPGRCCPPVSNRNVVPLSALIQVVLNPRKPLPPCRTAASNPTTGADLASGARAITHGTRGFTGTPNPDEKIPPKLNKQSKTDAADNHLNRLKPTVIIKRGFTQTTGRNHPRQQLRHAAACFHLEPKVTKQPHQETSLQ